MDPTIILDVWYSINGQDQKYCDISASSAGQANWKGGVTPTYSNGVLKLNQIHGTTTLGYIYGGIIANQANFGSSTASNQVFRVTLTSR